MKNLITLLFIGISFNLFADNIDLFIWAGQSNAQGFQGDAAFYPSDTDNLDNTIRLNWTVGNGGTSNGWTTMQPQDLGHYFPDGHFGPEVTFSRKLAQNGYNPAIFKYTQGATSIFQHWLNPGDGGIYDDMVTALNSAITDLENQGHVVIVKGFIWIQGESDSNSQASATAYFNNLTNIINDLRNNVVGNANLPIILGVDEHYFSTAGHEQSEILNAHEKIALTDDNIRFTSMYGYPKADITHLTPSGLITQGEDLFGSFQLLVSNEYPKSNCTLTSNGTTVSTVNNPILWGQSFSTECSGILSSITFNAATDVASEFTITLHNGMDCSADVLATKTINGIVDGDNLVPFTNDLYLYKDHTYYFNITSNDATEWQIRYNNTSNVDGNLKTFTNTDGATSCSRNFYNFDMDFSVKLTSNQNSCTIFSPGDIESAYDRPSWGQSFSPNCSGELSSITFSAASSPDVQAFFALYEGVDCNGPILVSKLIDDIVVGDNIILIDNELILDENNSYYFQIVSQGEVLWKINYSNTSTVDGNLYSLQGASYCGQSFPSFDMNFSVEIGSNNSQCADLENIYSFTYDNRTYEVVKEAKPWEDAALCAVNRGGYLARINNLAEQDAIWNELNNANITLANTIASNGGGASYVWLGGSDFEEDTWIWDGNNDGTGDQFWDGGVDGSPVDGLYSNWGNEPDNVGDQDGLAIALTQWPIGSGSIGAASQWNDLIVNDPLYYLIEYDTLLSINETNINDLKIYPNPVNDILTIENIKKPINTILIINSLGQIVNRISPEQNSNFVNISFSNIPNGVYFINIMFENSKTISKKVIK